jgi:non-specific serine/threonine protein kinase
VAEIRLTPTGHLRWEALEGQTEPTQLAALRRAFSGDWREGLFTLAAEKTGTGGSLTQRVLLDIWGTLDDWATEAISRAGGLEPFLETRAPKWHQVGRVCFHLAENKNDQARPFAFLATYATGFGAAGRLKHLPLRKALEQYSGAKNRSALIKLLSPVQAAAERCEWVMKLVDSGEVYQPMAWTAERAYTFLRTVPELEDSGLSVRLPDWWKKRARPQVSVTIGQKKKSSLGADALHGSIRRAAAMPLPLDFALLAAFCAVLFAVSLRNIRKKWIL